MRIYLKKLQAEDYISYMFCFVFGFNTLVFTFNNTMRMLVGNTHYLDSILMAALYCFVLFKTIPVLLKRIKGKHLLFITIVLFLPFLMCSNSDVVKHIFSNQVPYCVVAFLISISLSEYKKIWHDLYHFSWAVLLLSVIDSFALKLFDETSHTLGYAALFPAIVLAIEIVHESKKRLLNTMGLIISSILVIQADTTGALVAIAFSVILAMCFVIKRYKKWAFIIIVSLILVLTYLINNIVVISDYLATTLSQYGINVDLLLELSDTGLKTDRYRDSIYDYCINYSKEHWLFGCGIGNDRQLITNNTLVINQLMVTNYPHNLFLELIMQLGIPIGGSVSIFIIVFLFKYLISEKNLYAQRIAVVTVGMGFFPLLYSSSYIENAFFFALIGFAWKRYNSIKNSDDRFDYYEGTM